MGRELGKQKLDLTEAGTWTLALACIPEGNTQAPCDHRD